MYKNLYRCTERCLYEYLSNCEKIERLKRELALLELRGDVKVQSYGHEANCGNVSDPVFEYLVRLEKLEEKINRLERITTAVKKFIADLEEKQSRKNLQLLKILRLCYFERQPVETVVKEMRISRPVFYDRKRALVRRAMSFVDSFFTKSP